jgi:hypothetical protein
MDSTREQPAWTRPSFVLAAGLMVLVVLAAALIALFHHSGGSGTNGSGSAGGSSPQTSTTSTATAGPEPTTVPTTAPAGVTWKLVGQVALPFSASAGPRTVTESTASGYAHTPTGALIAAAQIGSRSGLSMGRAMYDPTIKNQFVPSTDRDTLLAALHAAPQESAEPGELSQFAGFQYMAYATDTAVIALIRRTGTTRYAITVTMQWRDGDWMMVAPPGGSWLSLGHQVTDMTAVVTWGAS